MSRRSRSVTRWSYIHDLTCVDAGPEAPPFQLTIRVHVHKSLLSRSSGSAAARRPPAFSSTNYMYDGYWETSFFLASLHDNLDFAIFCALDTIPVDVALYNLYGQKIRSDSQHLIEMAGGRNLLVEAHISLWIDEIRERIPQTIMSVQQIEDLRRVLEVMELQLRNRRVVVDTEAVLEDGEWTGKDGGDCSVCLENFVEGERVAKILTCGHRFHKECIVTWLTRGNNTCPLCRHAV